MIKRTLFRENDIRGVADLDLRDPFVEQLGRALATYFRRHSGNRVNLARDCRASSEGIRNALVRGLRAGGCDLTDVGVVPTPLLYYSVQHLHADGGVMITAGHNVSEHNGFKIVCGPGTIHGYQIQEVRDILENRDFASGSGNESTFDIVTPYVTEVCSQFDFPRQVNVVLDAANGTAGPVMRQILEKLNCKPTMLFFDVDGTFPNHRPDPAVAQNLRTLQRAVTENGAELGIAFDGGGDRIGAVDDQQKILWGDQLMILYSREVLARKPGATVVGEVKCSQTLYDDIRKHGGNPIMWRTGHSLIRAKMLQTNAELGGEMSGHIFFQDRYYGFDDALYAACRLMEIAATSPASLSAQLADVPQTESTPELLIECPDAIKFNVVDRLTDRFRKTHEIVDIDGVRISFPGGWGLVRASNTEPAIIMRFEATTSDLLGQYKSNIERAVSQARFEEVNAK